MSSRSSTMMPCRTKICMRSVELAGVGMSVKGPMERKGCGNHLTKTNESLRFLYHRVPIVPVRSCNRARHTGRQA